MMNAVRALCFWLVISDPVHGDDSALLLGELTAKWCDKQVSVKGLIRTPDEDIIEAFVGDENVVENVCKYEFSTLIVPSFCWIQNVVLLNPVTPCTKRI